MHRKKYVQTETEHRSMHSQIPPYEAVQDTYSQTLNQKDPIGSVTYPLYRQQPSNKQFPEKASSAVLLKYNSR